MAKTALSCSMRHTHPAGIPCLCRDSRTSRVPRACAPAGGVPEAAVTPPVSRSWLEPRHLVRQRTSWGELELQLPLRWLPSRRVVCAQVACDGCTYPRPPTEGFVYKGRRSPS